MLMIRTSALVAAGAALVLGMAPAGAAEQFCFGPTIMRSVPNPVFDGGIDTDVGWLNAFTYRGGDGTPDANIRLRGNTFQDGSHQWLALGVQALNDRQFDAGDTIVIMYKIRNASSYGLIQIRPLTDDSAGPYPVRSGDSSYSTSSDGTTWSGGGTAPSWITWAASADTGGGVCTAQQPGMACTWTVEIGIDIAQTGAGAPPDIEKLYVDVIEVFERTTTPETNANCTNAIDDDGDGTVNDGCPAAPLPPSTPVAETPAQCRNSTDDDGDGRVNDGCSAIVAMSRQFSWPAGSTIVDLGDTTTYPMPAQWGGAQVGGTSLCKGVFFGHDDISAEPLQPNGHLKAGLPETFTVKLHNSGTDAQGVIAHFSHARFGACGLAENCFQPMGSTSVTTSCPNGAAPPNCCTGTAGCIPPDPSAAGTGMQVTWTPTNAEEGHNCIRVKLEATVGGTTFVNQGDFHNMWIDHSSVVQTTARIDMKNVPAPEGGGKQRVRLTTIATTQFAFADGSVPNIPAGTLTAQIVRQYKAMRFTGKYVTTGRLSSQVWEQFGSFGFQLQHPLGLDVQREFNRKHSRLLWGGDDVGGDDVGPSLDIQPGTQDLETVRRANAALAKIPERPQVADWRFDIDQAKPVGRGQEVGGGMVEFEVPVNSVLQLPIKSTYGQGGGPPPPCSGGCCCRDSSSSKTTPSQVTTLGLFVMVGAVVCRRRRRR